MNGVEIILERETANDESATVVAIYAAPDSVVEAEAQLFDIENSKAVQELTAPCAGILRHDLNVGDTIQFGVPLAHIVAAEDREPAQERKESALGSDPLPLSAFFSERSGSLEKDLEIETDSALAPRFSRAATSLLVEHGFRPDMFAGSFVTSRDVQAKVEGNKTTSTTLNACGPRRLRAHFAEGNPVSRSKSAEIEVLSSGAGGTMLSVLGTTLGALPLRRRPDNFLDGQITDLVIYEASRLLRKYPKLNAAYESGCINEHIGVCAGLAMDRGGRLVVYGIEHADRLTIHELRSAIADAASRYMLDELSAAEMSRATFTVTDLSAYELDFVMPLLPRGQSLIIGITHSAKIGFRLFAGFDHRITEGRLVSEFLNELTQRLASFAFSSEQKDMEFFCHYCELSLHDATQRHKDRGMLKIIDRDGQEALCCASCWNGW